MVTSEELFIAGGDYTSSITQEIISDLRKSVFYYFDKDNIKRESDQQMLAAIELLALTCEYYSISPEIKIVTLHKWRKQYLALFDKRHPPDKDDYGYRKRPIIVATFEHMEKVIQFFDKD